MLRQSRAALGILPVAYPALAGHLTGQRFSFTVPVDVENGDIIELACIPATCRPIDIILDSDDLDSNGAPAIVVDVGLMSGDWGDNDNTRTCGQEFFVGATTAQAGGVARPTAKTAVRVPSAPYARSIGVKIVTKAATAQLGDIGLTVICAAD
ncbi:hypothetical protein [Aminobacter sp. MDW-2]|uniref:hypothetical protein n=1 Tax=Aminobacter sp. MDW-2 TaxID=2666139 RepID=UPI0012B05842|nr:hypothetical protein [Aminobacter sp. MDW-2]MRX32812.1 hypothetical protein [Aminobacter sp. MDW-2]QNH34529.1 hypothetical protein H5P29_00815 [Aminobacter sp. MDW-2]